MSCKTTQTIQPIPHFMIHHLVGDVASLDEPPPLALLEPPSCVRLRLNNSFAKFSNLALTSGDFSECSESECSCSELADRTLSDREIEIGGDREEAKKERTVESWMNGFTEGVVYGNKHLLEQVPFVGSGQDTWIKLSSRLSTLHWLFTLLSVLVSVQIEVGRVMGERCWMETFLFRIDWRLSFTNFAKLLFQLVSLEKRLPLEKD